MDSAMVVTAAPVAVPAAPEAQTSPDSCSSSALQEKLVSFDLSQSLGINFDAKLLAKSIQENSQAAQAGVCIGWRALSVGSESVQTTKDLVTKVKALKADGTDKIGITFAFPASAADASQKA